jgi:uncharacterized protein YcfJ
MRNFIDRSIRLSVLAAAVSFGVGAEPVAAQNTQRGAVIGGLGGAIAGALIGDHNDKAGAGAAIGGVIGAVGGAVVGNAKDKEVTYQRQQRAQAYQQRVYTQQQMQAAQIQSAVSIGDVLTMSKSGLSDSVMITQIQTRGIQQQLSVNDIIMLHQQGLSETVITAMQNARIGSAPSVTTVTTYPAPVVVQEQYVVPSYSPPPVYQQQRRVYHRGHYHYR